MAGQALLERTGLDLQRLACGLDWERLPSYFNGRLLPPMINHINAVSGKALFMVVRFIA